MLISDDMKLILGRQKKKKNTNDHNDTASAQIHLNELEKVYPNKQSPNHKSTQIRYHKNDVPSNTNGILNLNTICEDKKKNKTRSQRNIMFQKFLS